MTLLWIAFWQLAGALFVFFLTSWFLQGMRCNRKLAYFLALAMVGIWFLLGFPWLADVVGSLVLGQW